VNVGDCLGEGDRVFKKSSKVADPLIDLPDPGVDQFAEVLRDDKLLGQR
jgi:hypothetical protein